MRDLCVFVCVYEIDIIDGKTDKFLFIAFICLKQLFSTFRLQPLWRLHIRCPAYQIFALQLITVQNYGYEVAMQ